ncbi:sigma-70 family RNA polymerase sigma factor [Actinocorallia aurantiaca]|uniref:SigE family RNA polymerase sigma factor n=1 Tax=Actinocorallia aurantiaca TaxID=46204 RepID=A0ABP6G8B2_9ACTN
MADEQNFAEFYRGAYPGLVAELYAYTGDLAEAQEAAQEAFTRAWPRWNKVSSYDQPRAWVARVAYRLAVSRWRKARNTLLSFRRHGPPPDVPAPDAVSAELVEALRAIPEKHRRAVVLHHMGGYSVAEIAAMDGVAEGTVKAWLSRGRQKLAALLSDETLEANHHA